MGDRWNWRRRSELHRLSPGYEPGNLLVIYSRRKRKTRLEGGLICCRDSSNSMGKVTLKSCVCKTALQLAIDKRPLSRRFTCPMAANSQRIGVSM